MLGNTVVRKTDDGIQVTISSPTKYTAGVGQRVPLIQMQGQADQVVDLLRGLRDALDEDVAEANALTMCAQAAINAGIECHTYPALARAATIDS